MLSLITTNQEPIIVKIDDKEVHFNLFTMSMWGEILRRLQVQDSSRTRESVKGLDKEIAKELLRETNSKTYEIIDAINYALTMEGIVDVLHISCAEKIERDKIGSITDGDIHELGSLVVKILALPEGSISEEVVEGDIKKKE